MNSSNSQTFTRVIRGDDNSTIVVSVNGPAGSPLENAFWRDPFGMGLFDFIPISVISDANIAEFVMGGGPPPRPPTSRDVLNNLPVKKVEVKDGCPICQSDLEIGENAMVLPCTHQFHPDCVRPWLVENNTCPTCRYELDTDDARYNEQIRQRRANENTSIPPAVPAIPGATVPSSTPAPALPAPAPAPAPASAPLAPSSSSTVLVPTRGTVIRRPNEAIQNPNPMDATPGQPALRRPSFLPWLLNRSGTTNPIPNEEPRVHRESARRPLTITIDPAVLAYATRAGIPLSQLIPLLLQRGAEVRVQTEQPERRVVVMRNDEPSTGTETRLNAADENVIDAALREFDLLERQPTPSSASTSQPRASPRESAVVSARSQISNVPLAPEAQRRASRRPQERSTPETHMPDLQAAMTAAHLQALTSHSQMMQMHSEFARQHGSNLEEHQRAHLQAMSAHSDLMAAHRQFMAAHSKSMPHQERKDKAKEGDARSERREEAQGTSLQETMARNLRQYFGGPKKRKNTNRDEASERKSRNVDA